ncbi:ZrgA family zinc uptake protein [Alteromonas halophila]|nr:DUF2796 domain-containing protein [Alteromonas halophila]
MKIFFTTALIVSAVTLSWQLRAQAHVHGQAKLLIAQEGNVLHLELSIPVADALGFEHTAQTTAEKKVLKDLAMRLERNANIVEIDGQCALQNVSHSLAAEVNDSHVDHGDSHHHEHEADKHGHDERHHHAQENEDHHIHESHGHRDVNAHYQFHCDDEVSAIRAVLFESMPSLNVIQAQWVTDKAQGARDLRPAVTGWPRIMASF